MNNGKKIIAVDFDGTLCENAWPEIGAANRELINFIRVEKMTGHKLILWTSRVGDRLNEAVEWCKQQGLIFDAVNENLPESIEAFGGDTRKIFADVYIDDGALGVPLTTSPSSVRPFVDWVKVREWLVKEGYL